MAQIGLLGVPGLTLADANQFSYGPKGEMAPESALKEQALNRKRQIANILIQRGLAGSPGGKMVGRFYVADSPVQGAAGLAQTLAGVVGNKFLDKDQDEIAKSDRQMVTDAIMGYRQRQQQLDDVQQAPVGVPQPAAPQGQASPAPDQPYQGEVGAVPMPEPGVQSEKPPIQLPPLAETMKAMPDYATLEGTVKIDPKSQAAADRGLDMGNIQPADMGQVAGQAPPPGMESPPPPITQEPEPAMPVQARAPRKETMDDLVDLLTHQHPAVRRFGEMQAAMLQKQEDTANQREWMTSEKAADREVRREGILENSRMREAQMQNTMALTQMQIDSRMQQGRDANDLKASLAQQANDLQKLQMQTMAELKKAEIGSRAQTAKQHDETLKAIAGMNIQGKKDVAGMKQGAGKTLPGSVGTKFMDNAQNLRMAENALSLISGETIEGVKGDTQATGLKGMLPDAVLQRMDPSGVDTRAAIANLGSMIVHDRSGAAVTAAEFPRLRPFIPSSNDHPDTVKKKLRQFVNEYRKHNEEMADFYTEAGYQVPDMSQKSKSAAPSAGGGTSSGGWSIKPLP